MARSGEIGPLDWANGSYTFRMGWGELIKLQEEVDAGPWMVLQRLSTGAWGVKDISAIIRLGLIGGGLEPGKALALVRDYVEERPPAENLSFATGILYAAVQGAPDGEQPGEADAPVETTSD